MEVIRFLHIKRGKNIRYTLTTPEVINEGFFDFFGSDAERLKRFLMFELDESGFRFLSLASPTESFLARERPLRETSLDPFVSSTLGSLGATLSFLTEPFSAGSKTTLQLAFSQTHQYVFFPVSEKNSFIPACPATSSRVVYIGNIPTARSLTRLVNKFKRGFEGRWSTGRIVGVRNICAAGISFG